MNSTGAASRIRAVLEMYEVGESMYRTRMRREHPDAPDSEIEALVNQWRIDRPEAPVGDAEGVSAARRFE